MSLNMWLYSYFDTAVNEHLIRAGGLDIRAGPEIGLVVETSCRFLKPLSFPEVVDAGMRVSKLGNSSVTYEIGLFRQGDDEPAATGRFVHVWVDRMSRRPIASPVHSAVGASVGACDVAATAKWVRERIAVPRKGYNPPQMWHIPRPRPPGRHADLKHP